MPKFFLEKRKSNSFSAKLADPSYYEFSIDRLHSKFSSGNPQQLYEEDLEGVAFAQIYFDKKKIAKILARDVSCHRYNFSPAEARTLLIGKKQRRIFGFSIFDRIVHYAVFKMVSEDAKNYFPSQVYSYIKGRSRADAIKSFVLYLNEHVKQNTNPNRRGIYVYRFDIKSYGESIPVCPSSVLWKELDHYIKSKFSEPLTSNEWILIQKIVRPIIKDSESGEYENLVGIADGAPITSILLNVYVAELDKYIASIKGGIFARYGDDILFAHSDKNIFMEAVNEIKAILNKLKLKQNVQKTKIVFFNKAGRSVDNIQGSTVVEYLGMQIHFDGTIALKTDKIIDLMKELKHKMLSTANMLSFDSLDKKGILVCKVINELLNPGNNLSDHHVISLLNIVNHRGQLNDVDYRIARLVLYVLTGDASVKKFRTIHYKKRGLISLEYVRNKKNVMKK
jgi:retron-type reverse transcriptase